MSLTSAPPPDPGPTDHVRGQGRLVVVYADYECPYCAAADASLRRRDDLQIVFRHFPISAGHPRALPAAYAAEAAALQGAFWPMHDALFGDQGRLEDPHLWARAERLGLDVDRFDADRRSPGVAARITTDFRSGVRAGVAQTPTLFSAGRAFTRDTLGEL